MRRQHIAKTAFMLATALAFALLAGLHLARPVSQAPDVLAMGLTVQDICGYGGEGESRDCPNCTLSKAAVLAGLPSQILPGSTAKRLEPPVHPVALRADPASAYHARAPPVFA